MTVFARVPPEQRRCMFVGDENTVVGPNGVGVIAPCPHPASWKMRLQNDPFAAQVFWPPDGKPQVCQRHCEVMLVAAVHGRNWQVDRRWDERTGRWS